MMHVTGEHYFERVEEWWVCECGLWRGKYGHDMHMGVEEQAQ